MQEYKFESSWVSIKSSLPKSGERCIVTDGDSVVIGTYAGEAWILDGITNGEPYKIIGWMPTPKPMQKTVPYETRPKE